MYVELTIQCSGYLGRAKVRQTEAFLVGLAVEKADMAKLHESGFHAMYTYFAATGFTYGSSPHNWDEMCQFCLKNDMVFIPSVGPGYDGKLFAQKVVRGFWFAGFV